MRISMIVAVDENGLIGSGNTLPWGRISADLKRFRVLTMGKPVIMGRNTFESILAMNGGPLKDRVNIVLSHNREFERDDCVVVHTPEEALAVAGDVPEVMIIGGASVYKTFAPYANRLYLTRIHASFDGDTYFPITDFNKWDEILCENIGAGANTNLPLTFYILERKNH